GAFAGHPQGDLTTQRHPPQPGANSGQSLEPRGRHVARRGQERRPHGPAYLRTTWLPRSTYSAQLPQEPPAMEATTFVWQAPNITPKAANRPADGMAPGPMRWVL